MTDENEKVDKSIIDPKYRETMIGASDWVGEIMEAAALTRGVGAMGAVTEEKNEEGTVTVVGVRGKKGKDHWDIDSMFALAENNAIDTAKYEGSRDAVGRMRMTLSNMLRARAKRRHGLFDLDRNWVKTPKSFEVGDLTETPEGVKIPKEKPKKVKKDEK